MLGLTVVLLDFAHEFALLTAGNGRLGLQGTSGPPHRAEEPGNVGLVFQVKDVDAERRHLIGRGIEVSVPIDNDEELFREVRSDQKEIP